MVSSPSCPTYYHTGITPDILDIILISNFPSYLYHKVLNELNSDHTPVLTIQRRALHFKVGKKTSKLRLKSKDQSDH